ncbi:unnamed protein product [Closterium sp. Yama58-4]|nr:unnamed protein product [Closterium sp. Yama58-4]
MGRPEPASPGEIVFVELRNKYVELEPYFSKLNASVNVRLASNRGVLTYLQTRAAGSWAQRFSQIGMRLPYAVGCFLRFLFTLRPEVQALVRGMEQQLRAAMVGEGGQARGVATVGIHIRVKDGFVWDGKWGDGDPKQLNDEQVAWLGKQAKEWIDCALKVEGYWFPSSLGVRWMLITNSAQLKQAIKSQYPDKVFTTDFVPRHSNNLGAVDTEASRRPAGMVAPDAEYTDANISTTAAASNATSTTIEKDKQEEARLFQEVVTEWLLLASCDAYVVSESGYSHTAVFYARRPMAAFQYDRCDPELPVQTTIMGQSWSGI